MTRSTKPEALYGIEDAAAYLGLTVRTLRYHIYQSKRLAPDKRIGATLIFRQSTLDAFAEEPRISGKRPDGTEPPTKQRRGKLRSEGIYSLSEAVEYLGLRKSQVSYAVWVSGDLQADAKIGTALVFWKKTLDNYQKLRAAKEKPKKAAKTRRKSDLGQAPPYNPQAQLDRTGWIVTDHGRREPQNDPAQIMS